MAWLAIRLWNLGKGPAIVQSVELNIGPTRILERVAQQMAIGAGQVRDELLPLVHGTTVPHDARRLTGVLVIHYQHSDGTGYRTECTITVNDGDVVPETFARTRIDQRPEGVVV